MQRLIENLKGWGLALIIFLCPPLGLGLLRGFGYSFWVCLLFTMFGYIPGLLYACWRTIRSPDGTIYVRKR